MRNKKKILSIVLSLMLLFFAAAFIGNPETAEAAETYDLSVGDYQCNYNEDGTLTIMDYNGKEETLTIPSILADRKVTAIGESAFAFDYYLKNVTISSGITRIEKNAFKYSDIEKLTIPESVTFIGEYAFGGMDELTSITLPSGVTELSAYLFYSCDNLSSVQLNGNITSIGDGAFEASGIQSMIMQDSVTQIGSYTFENCEKLKNITLSKKLTEIPYRAFTGAGIESIVIPEGVKEIQGSAFLGCEALEQISLPVSLETIGSGTFQQTGLKRLVLGENVSVIDSNNGGPYSYYSGVNSFLGSSSLYIEVSPNNKNFSSGNGVLYNKEQSALLAYPSAKGAVTVPNTVTAIGVYAFAYSEVESVQLPDSITTIASEAFYSSELTTIGLGNGLESISASAFAYCENLTSIRIPASVKSISGIAFYGSGQLAIAVAEENENFSGEDGVLYNKEKTVLLAAPGVSGEYTIKNGVIAIANYAFAYNNNIIEVHTGDTVTEIGSWAFENCESLKRLILGDGITTLNEYIVSGCKKLRFIEGGKYATDVYKNVTEDGKLYTAFYIGYISGETKNAMIIGEEDSGIVRFAMANNLPYMIPGELGDVNCDGEITTDDALTILKEVVGIEEQRYFQGAADCDRDGQITTDDALTALKYAVGILNTL